jgi:hypothetical protein
MDTLTRLISWLADHGNFEFGPTKLSVDFQCFSRNSLNYTGVRRPFVTRNGISISIQQSSGHYCNDESEVELWHCPPNPIIAPYGDGENPYAYVPLAIVAGYIDSLESLGDNHEHN